MKLTGWALAMVAGLTSVSASAQAPVAADPTATTAVAAAAPAATDAAPAAAAPAADAAAAVTAPTPGIGIPDGRMGLQDQFTPIGLEGAAFHDNWLMPLIVAISIFVLVLLLWTMIRYRRGANPVPSKTSHNTLIEVIWTLVPVIILVVIAIPSIRLISHQYSPPKADLTIKVVGNQWYWTYQYPDNGDFEIVSNMLKEKADVKPGERYRTDADGPPLLAVDERIVIPAGKTVKFLVTSNDVIHSFAVPAFWTKMDANPGRINETWVKVDRPGVYFGQCSELCGARHGYMPIAVEVVSPEKFAAWVAGKGGTMPGATPAAAPAAAADAPAAATPAEAAPQPAATPAEAAPTNTTAAALLAAF